MLGSSGVAGWLRARHCFASSSNARCLPAVEEMRRRTGIEPPWSKTQGLLREVFAIVSEHVQERPPYLERCAQLPRVIAISKYASLAPARAVYCQRDAAREPLHTARQRPAVVGFSDQVDMIPLHGILRQAEAELLAGPGKCSTNRAEYPPRAQTDGLFVHAQRYVQGVMSTVRRPRTVRNARVRQFRTTRAGASAARAERECLLRGCVRALARPLTSHTGSALRKTGRGHRTPSACNVHPRAK